MAEFGIATGVLQVAGFGAALGSTLWTYAKEVGKANKDLETIAGRVEATAKCLDSVGTLLQDPQTKALHTAKLYDDTRVVCEGCREVFRELEAAVQVMKSKAGSKAGKLHMPWSTRLGWPLSNGRLAELQQVLQHYTAVLHFMLSVLQIVESRRAATKDEVRSLESQLTTLAMSNATLSQSNASLTQSNQNLAETLAKRPQDPFMGLSVDPTVALPSTQAQAGSGTRTRSSTSTTPASPAAISSAMPINEHLRRCLSAVNDLAQSITSAIEVWNGGKPGASLDIHGLHADATALISGVPTHLQCKMCSREVTWREMGSYTAGLEGDCCACWIPSSVATWEPVGGMTTQGQTAEARKSSNMPLSLKLRPFVDQSPNTTPLTKLSNSNDIPQDALVPFAALKAVPSCKTSSRRDQIRHERTYACAPTSDDQNPTWLPPPAMLAPMAQEPIYMEMQFSPVQPMPSTEHPRQPDERPSGSSDPNMADVFASTSAKIDSGSTSHHIQRSLNRMDPPMTSDGRYCCNKCANETFDRKCEWSKHMDKHDRPYRCPQPQCAAIQGFTYCGGLLRHEREVHGKHGGPREQFYCTVLDCKRRTGKGFTRKQSLIEHLRRVHNVTGGPDRTHGDASDAVRPAPISSPFRKTRDKGDSEAEGQGDVRARKRTRLDSMAKASGPLGAEIQPKLPKERAQNESLADNDAQYASKIVRVPWLQSDSLSNAQVEPAFTFDAQSTVLAVEDMFKRWFGTTQAELLLPTSVGT